MSDDRCLTYLLQVEIELVAKGYPRGLAQSSTSYAFGRYSGLCKQLPEDVREETLYKFLVSSHRKGEIERYAERVAKFLEIPIESR